MMSEATTGKSVQEAQHLCDEMTDWFGHGNGSAVNDPPPDLVALSAVREYPARRRCVLISWDALKDALASLT